MPIKENTSTIFLSAGTDNANFPSISVATPKDVPLMNTDTPGSTSPLSSVTFPVILISFVCCVGCIVLGEITI